ncbi:NAD(P)/FAD-dependent oxidoreductase [Streptomyces sp. NBC_01429]|uniref:NAD(P)/FAD-dependent oxidoreductase n=1 Tax=Streptomyces sp. NBC_01429 TaxID=2903862 RepID=UPI002E2DF58D|nr:NAD(P)/FAD-dependent oxidoreductase [Streptomyces sp. NBC_01429]
MGTREQSSTRGRLGTADRYDAVVIGGGAAGLSGALTLARARRSVLVIDEGRPRNAPASGIHGYLGLDGTAPAELLAAGRREVTGYGGEIVDGTVVTARRLADDAGFRVELADGSSVTAARLLVTTGLTDELPEVPGLAGRWGREVLHCPYCHGWEVRDEPIGVLSSGPLGVHQALMWRQWSKDVTLFLHTGPEPDDEEYERLAAREIAVVDGEVTGVEVTGDRLAGVRLADGRTLPCQAVVVAPRFTARAGFLTGLGLDVTEQEMSGHVVATHIAADPTGATGVPGVWVAGNVTNPTAQVNAAATGGTLAGAAINADLTAEEIRVAVAERRASGPARTTTDDRKAPR